MKKWDKGNSSVEVEEEETVPGEAMQEEVDLSPYRAEEFDWMQLDEIRLGLEHKLDVSLYADSKYLSFQMREIRLGLENKVDVNWYCNNEFDWFQMCEIRKGLERNIDVSLYASTEYNHLVMREIRKGLQININLLPYVKEGYNNSIIRMIRKSKTEKINLEPYIQLGYDSDQLEQILLGLEKKIKVDTYTNLLYTGSQMKQIRLGLMACIDVTPYLGEQYNWMQMQEIRLGIEKKLDYFWYTDCRLSARQMREVRLGLEGNNNVLEYISYVWSASDMRYMRENPGSMIKREMLEVGTKEDIPVEKSTHVVIECSSDEMEATMWLENTDNKEGYSMEYIKQELEKANIVSGVMYDEIKEMLDKERYEEYRIIARGKQCEDGKDGHYEYFFDKEKKRTPVILEDGTVDYSNPDLFTMVTKGQKLAVYVPATRGVYGYTVKGKMLTPKMGHNIGRLTGKGVELLDDGVTYVASIDGKVEFKNDNVYVVPVYIYDGNLSTAVGNINFNGDVHILGDVSAGVSIEANGDIVVEGIIGAANLKAGKNIRLHSGVSAGMRGKIEAAGSIYGKYFEEANLLANENIEATYLLNCNCVAMKQIMVLGQKGIIIGGHISAILGIEANTVGNHAEVKTDIELGRIEYYNTELSNIQERIRHLQEEVGLFEKKKEQMLKMTDYSVLSGMTIFNNLQHALVLRKADLEKLEQDKNKLLGLYGDRESLIQLKVNRTIYPGCFIKINENRYRTKEEMDRVAFRSKDEHIILVN